MSKALGWNCNNTQCKCCNNGYLLGYKTGYEYALINNQKVNLYKKTKKLKTHKARRRINEK